MRYARSMPKKFKTDARHERRPEVKPARTWQVEGQAYKPHITPPVHYPGKPPAPSGPIKPPAY
jgi:hypothetical protein